MCSIEMKFLENIPKENKPDLISNNSLKISCEIRNLFDNRKYDHERSRIENFIRFFHQHSEIYKNFNSEKIHKIYKTQEDSNNIIKSFSKESQYKTLEEDVIILPYKPEGVKEVIRRFFLPKELFSMSSNKIENQIEEIFAIEGFCILSNSGRTYKSVISKLKLIKKTRNTCSIIYPKLKTKDSVDFVFKTAPKYIYILLIKLKNGTYYISQPITNRSFKHYTQRPDDNIFKIFEKKNKIGMLFYNYNAIICEEGLRINPIYSLNLYKAEENYIQIDHNKATISIDNVIPLLKSMKNINEKNNIKLEKFTMNKSYIINNCNYITRNGPSVQFAY
ncbi:hypothetical protein H8356DRAFT_1662987 [Neocallimastix lanati (nom. inval.)]|uniref:Uncharacterized protein n=1 Tax=Neocallimastix californiae TaxID=1754190 RepID=A0A1Y1ZPV8_9FUNG|nr:hypothetical protein H8356DRAFT_1662987 [Neocallimastix sp. JGI-2020a]ORY12280.1 hypothetical protein LY90DRAFT_637083 [Neocallimastix californiae]|eukprot:ORY12280.1 hypothetical protein LY90DRAFT_637083 [Neocallimastix californiae]